jgi:hypothetical protein
MKPRASRARVEAAHMNKPAVGELREATSEPGITSGTSRAALAKQPATKPAEAPEQFIVFAAWERVETSGPFAQNVADYDTNPAGTNSSPGTDANPSAQSTAQADPSSPKFTSRFTVTRLIFRVVPTNAQTGSKPGSNSSSKPVQPMAIPIGDGWFVIQL